MKWDMLKKEIDLQTVLAFLDDHTSDFCALIALLFFTSPIVEMIVCLFDRVERFYPIITYPTIVNGFNLSVSALLAVGALAGILHRVRRQGLSFLGLLRKNPMYAFFLVMVFWMLLASLVNGKPIFEFGGDWYRNEPIQLVVAYFLVYLFCGTLIRKSHKELLVVASLVFSMVLGVYSSIHHALVLAGRELSISEYSVAVFFQHNHYGYYLAIHIMLASAVFTLDKRRWARILALGSLIENTAVLSMNNTFGAWLACFIAFIFQIIVLRIVYGKLNRRTLVAMGCFLGVTFIMSFWTSNIFSAITQFLFDLKSVLTDPRHSDNAGTTRWKLWKFTAERISERPVFGFGNEGINHMLEAATGSSRPHNELLQYAAFYGIPAALLYLAGVMSIFLRGYKERAALDSGTLICLIGAFAYLVSSMFGNTMFYTAPFFFLLLGMGYVRER